jgi:uncharacterized protein (TIGR02145 family)
MKRIFFTLTLVLFVIPFGISQTLGTSIDQNGNSFTWKKIGNQYWSTINTNIESYRDGTPIPQVTDASEWGNLTTGAWCYYDNDPSNGKLYNWYAVAGIHDNDENTPNKEFAPKGWQVPNDAEWNILITFLEDNGFNFDLNSSENTLAKSVASNFDWHDSNVVGSPGNDEFLNNSSGLNFKPMGYRMDSQRNSDFDQINKGAFFWSNSDDENIIGASRYGVAFDQVYISLPGDANDYNGYKDYGFSVRLVSQSPSDILLNGTISAENHQIKNIVDPTDAQDAATKVYVDSNINSFSGSYNDLTDKPTSFSGDLSGNVTSNFLKLNPLTQAEIDNLNPEAGTIVFNADSEKFIGYSGSASQELDQSQENQNQLFDNPNTAQSFTAGSSGSLSKIDVKLSNRVYGQPDNSLTLTLREGEGTDGNMLFSTGLSTSSYTAEWISVDISGVEITQGSKYTIHLTSTSFFEDEVFMWARDNTNPYQNGKSFYSNIAYTEYDLCFKTYIGTTGWVDLN